MSPFCMKLECYLRLTGTPHEVRGADFRKAPKGKIPFVEIDGELMGDSQLIIERLKVRDGDPLDGWLTDEQRAIGHAVRRMVEEGMYFVGVYARWIDDGGWKVLRPAFALNLPAPLRPIMPLIRRRVRNALIAQGTGRHKPEEIWALGRRDLAAIATLLGDKAWLFGDRPCSVDCSLWAFLEALAAFPYESPQKHNYVAHPNLVAYRDRIRSHVFDAPARTVEATG